MHRPRAPSSPPLPHHDHHPKEPTMHYSSSSPAATSPARPEEHSGDFTQHQAGHHGDNDVPLPASLRRAAAAPSNRAPRIAHPCPHGGIHEHGTRVAYVKDKCRCEPCTTVAREYEQKRRRDRLYGIGPGLVDTQPVRDHLAVLSNAGIGYKRAALLAGVSVTIVQTILYHHPSRPNSGPSKRVKAETAQKLLAVQPSLELIGDGTPVPSRGAARRIQALVARGWSQAKLADRVGVTDQIMAPLLAGRPANAATVRAIHDVYEQLWDQAPPTDTHRDRLAASRARNRAARMGWAPPAAWDDIDHDDAPQTGIDIRLTMEERLDDLEFLLEAGTPGLEAARRVGFPTVLAAERAAARAGRNPLSAVVRRAA